MSVQPLGVGSSADWSMKDIAQYIKKEVSHAAYLSTPFSRFVADAKILLSLTQEKERHGIVSLGETLAAL